MYRSVFFSFLSSFVLALILDLALPVTAIADCSDVELTAVFLVSDIYPLGAPQLTLLDIAAIGPVTNPSEVEMVAAAQAVQPESYYHHMAQAGPFHLFVSEPDDWGACAIVDGRDGRVVFAGTVIWMGEGTVTLPVESSHLWAFSPGDPAPPPESIDILPNGYWSDQYGTQVDITGAVVEYLRDSNVMHSFGDCDSYDVVSYIYTPTVGTVWPDVASSVIILSGRCGPPWNDVITAVPPSSVATRLMRVAPNPFNPRTTVSFTLPAAGPAQVAIYDARGMEVARLVDESLAAGAHTVDWDGEDTCGTSMPSGTYFCRLTTPWGFETRKMSLLR